MEVIMLRNRLIEKSWLLALLTFLLFGRVIVCGEPRDLEVQRLEKIVSVIPGKDQTRDVNAAREACNRAVELKAYSVLESALRNKDGDVWSWVISWHVLSKIPSVDRKPLLLFALENIAWPTDERAEKLKFANGGEEGSLLGPQSTLCSYLTDDYEIKVEYEDHLWKKADRKALAAKLRAVDGQTSPSDQSKSVKAESLPRTEKTAGSKTPDIQTLSVKQAPDHSITHSSPLIWIVASAAGLLILFSILFKIRKIIKGKTPDDVGSG